MSRTRWNDKYHMVFIPKRRKKLLFGKLMKHIGEVLHDLTNQKESAIVEDQRFIKGQSAVAVVRQLGGGRSFTEESFWIRGEFMSTVRLDEGQIKAYIRDQEKRTL